MTGVRWLLFDVGGVLERVDDATWPAAFETRWAARLGLGLEQFRARLVAAQLPAASVRAGVEEEFWQGYAAAVGADQGTLAAMRADFWDCYCGTADTVLLDAARSWIGRVGLAILSNSGDGARREEERRFGYSKIFDPICYSHEIGVGKPDPRAFEIALAAMGAAEPAEVFFVDDLASNVEAAADLGLRTFLHTDTPSTLAALSAAVSG